MVMVRMPASREGTFSWLWIRAVTVPASAPAAKANKMPTMTGCPADREAAAAEAPRGKEPSTVRSGKLRTLKVMKTPRAIRA